VVNASGVLAARGNHEGRGHAAHHTGDGAIVVLIPGGEDLDGMPGEWGVIYSDHYATRSAASSTA
jgi:hypothetical protein